MVQTGRLELTIARDTFTKHTPRLCASIATHKGQQWLPHFFPARCRYDTSEYIGASEGNRTLIICLEGRGFAIKLHLQIKINELKDKKRKKPLTAGEYERTLSKQPAVCIICAKNTRYKSCNRKGSNLQSSRQFPTASAIFRHDYVCILKLEFVPSMNRLACYSDILIKSTSEIIIIKFRIPNFSMTF